MQSGKTAGEIEVDVESKPGLLNYPTEFRCQVTPRSKKHIELIKEVEKKHPWEPSDANQLDSIKDFEIMY